MLCLLPILILGPADVGVGISSSFFRLPNLTDGRRGGDICGRFGAGEMSLSAARLLLDPSSFFGFLLYGLLGFVGGGPKGCAGGTSSAGVGGCDVFNLILNLAPPGVVVVGVASGVAAADDGVDVLSLSFILTYSRTLLLSSPERILSSEQGGRPMIEG